MKGFVVALLLCISAIAGAQTPWVTVYYGSWTAWNAVPVTISDLDFSCGTHWIFFTRGPHADGTFDSLATNNPVDKAFVDGAHAAGAKALMGTGGFGADYTGAVTHIQASVAYLVGLVNRYGYDGIDIDWEPVPAAQYSNFTAWVQALRAAKPGMLITAAAFNYDQGVVNNQASFDQINLMTYDMSGGWCSISWHNSAIYGANAAANTGSIDATVSNYLSHGVPASKLGFGIELYAYVWHGVTGPNQTGWGQIENTVPYWKIMSDYYDAGAVLKFDSVAQSAYFSAPSAFVTMGGMETDFPARAAYVKAKGLGGVIIYDAGVGKVLNQSPQNRVMQQIRAAFLGGPTLPPLKIIPPPPPPVKKSMIVYDNAVQPPWTNLSAVQGGINEAAADPTNANNKVISVGYYPWNELRYYTGPWGNQPPVASDTLAFDMYPSGASFTATVWIEGSGVRTFFGPAGTWTHVTMPCPPSVFTYFDIQNNTANQATVYFDNIHFSAGPDTVVILPPPPMGTGCGAADSTRIAVASYAAGVTYGKTLVPPPVHDTTKVYLNGANPNAVYVYFTGTYTDTQVDSLIKSGAYLPGQWVIGTKSGTKTPVHGFKPR